MSAGEWPNYDRPLASGMVRQPPRIIPAAKGPVQWPLQRAGGGARGGAERRCTREALPVGQGLESSGFGTSGLAVNTITMAGHSRGIHGLVPGRKPAEGLCDAPIPPGVKALIVREGRW